MRCTCRTWTSNAVHHAYARTDRHWRACCRCRSPEREVGIVRRRSGRLDGSPIRHPAQPQSDGYEHDPSQTPPVSQVRKALDAGIRNPAERERHHRVSRFRQPAPIRRSSRSAWRVCPARVGPPASARHPGRAHDFASEAVADCDPLRLERRVQKTGARASAVAAAATARISAQALSTIAASKPRRAAPPRIPGSRRVEQCGADRSPSSWTSATRPRFRRHTIFHAILRAPARGRACLTEARYPPRR